MLTDDEIKDRVENAFSPHRCVAEVFDYNQKLRFKVFGKNDESLAEMPSIILRKVRDPQILEQILAEVRSRIAK